MLKNKIKSLLRPAGAALALGVSTLTTVTPHSAVAATAMIFCNGNMADPATLTTAKINGYRASGMNTMVIFTMEVQASGDFTYGPYTLCSGGNYVGPSNWASLLNQCKAAPSSVNRIEMCIGQWGSASFANIKNIIAAQGNNTGNILWKNLVALRNALPINAIDFDDETTYDSSSAVVFGGMAGSMGFKVTLCPYTNPGFWQAVKNGLGGYCDAVYLQCYDGGAGNNPATWDGYFGGFKVIPGYWDYERNATFLTKMQSWAQSQASVGGFLWPSCSGCNPPADGNEMLQYANWIHQAMDIPQGVYYIGSYGVGGKALQGTSDSYLNGSGQYVGGCNEVALTPFNSNAQQQWSVLPIGGGQYHLMNTASGQLLQSTGDPYHAHGGGNVGGCNKAALTPNTWNLSQQIWLLPATGAGYALANPANSQYLQATLDGYWANATQSYVSGCYQMACTPYSWGAGTYDQWNLVWIRN